MPEAQRRLAESEVVDRIDLFSTKVVSDIHDYYKGRVAAEEARGMRLEQKAAGLLGVNALSVTIALTLSARVFEASSSGKGDAWLPLFLVPFVVLIAAGVIVGACAYKALLAEKHAQVSETQALDPKALEQADQLFHGETRSEDAALAHYRKHLARCFKDAADKNEDVNARKVGWVGRGQRAFLVVLATIAVLGVMLALRALFPLGVGFL